MHEMQGFFAFFPADTGCVAVPDRDSVQSIAIEPVKE